MLQLLKKAVIHLPFRRPEVHIRHDKIYQVEKQAMASPLIIAALAAGISGYSAPIADPGGHLLVRAAMGCGAAASRVVEETGGQLLSAQPSGDGQSCVVTVLVQGNGNERPRKVTIRVPM